MQNDIMKKAFLWGWYGYKNFGDDLLLDTMVRKLETHNIHITIAMKTPYGKYENIPGIVQVKRTLKNMFLHCSSNDILIIGPGGLFPFDNYPKLVAYYFAVLWWRINKKRIAFIGIGISPDMGRKSKHLWRKIINMSDMFYTRSDGFLKAVGAYETDTIKTTADIAFASDLLNTEDNRFSSTKQDKVVGITVANLFDDNDSKKYKEAVEVWKKTCMKVIKLGYRVDLIAFTKGKDERMIADIIKQLDFNRGGVRQVPYPELSDCIANWDRYSFTICMRFHALVVSILKGIPSIPIAYGHKTKSLANKCGLNDYVIVWNSSQIDYYGRLVDTSSEEIIHKVELLTSNLDREKSIILKKRNELILSAESCFKELFVLLK